jgi:hypothetical protein
MSEWGPVLPSSWISGLHNALSSNGITCMYEHPWTLPEMSLVGGGFVFYICQMTFSGHPLYKELETARHTALEEAFWIILFANLLEHLLVFRSI